MSIVTSALLVLLPALAQERVALPGHPPEVEAPETFAVPVRFLVQTRLAYDGAGAPGIRVEIGVGRKDDAPGFLDRPVLAEGTSDEEGRIELVLPVPMTWRDDFEAQVWARVEMPGLTRRTVLRTLRPGADDGPTQILLRTGGTVFGTLRTPTGEPLVDGRVWLLREGGAEPSVRSALTDDAGRFAVDHFQAGAHVLHGRASGVGSAISRVLDLDPRRHAEPVELELVGGVSFRGRVLDPAGMPVPGVKVHAVPSGWDELPDAAACREAERAGGLFEDSVQTDREGRFELSALVPGEYRLFADWVWGSAAGSTPLLTLRRRLGGLGEVLGTIRVEEGAEPLDLVLRQHRLEVRFLDARSRPIDLEERAAGRERSKPVPWSLQPTDATDDPIRRGALLGDLVVWPVEPDQSYLVSWEELGVPYSETVVDVVWGVYRVPLVVQLGADGEGASLTVRVVGPDGRPWDEEPQARIVSAAGGRELADSAMPDGWNRVRDSTWSVALPPGRFLVEGSAEPLWGCIVPSPLPRAPFLPVSKEVDLAAGEERSLEIRLGEAGHLDLVSRDARKGPTPEEEELFHDGNWLRPELAREPLGGGTAILVGRDGRRIEGLSFEVPGVFWSLNWITPGWDARVLTPLPPGRWTLRVEDGETVLYEHPVTIEAGRVTTLLW